VSAERIRDELQALIDARPDAINPTDENGRCLYDDGKGGHCIAGEWAASHGHRVPPAADSSLNAKAAAEMYGWGLAPDEAEYLRLVQRIADGFGDGSRIPKRWADIALPDPSKVAGEQ
jgi:hypothetical protein